MRLSHKHPYLAALVLAVALIAGCGMEEIKSSWCDRQSMIDEAGFVKWENAGKPFVIGDVSVNVLNDRDTVYMRLVTTNPGILARFVSGGFTVWFDEKGSDRKTYSVRFPLPLSRAAAERFAARKDDGKRDMLAERLREIAQGDIEISRPSENEFSTLSADYSAPYGIRCRLQYAKGTFSYELYMPLVRDNTHPYAIAEKKPKIVGIGLETGIVVQQQRFQENRTQRRTASPMEKMGTDSGPQTVGNYQEAGKGIDKWLKVNLAEK